VSEVPIVDDMASGDRLAEHLSWCKTRGLRETTRIQRRNAIGRFTRATGMDPLVAPRDVVETWWYGLTATAGSRAVELSHLQAYLRWARRHDLMEGDPTARIDRPRVPRTLPRPIAEDKLQQAIAQADARMRFMVCSAAFCGLRCIEIAAAEWSHFIDSPDGQLLHIPIGKGGSSRVVPVHEQVSAALRGLPGVHRGRVVRRVDGQPGPVRPARLSREINNYLHGLGIEDTAHSLRHRYGTTVYRVSHDILLTRGLMGHTSVNTTAGYIAWDTSQARDVIARLPGGLVRAAG
jgi:integrase